MVWVVEGTLNSEATEPADLLPPVTTHWLRPGRTYKVGRLGGVRAPPKNGKQGPASRHRPYDFKLASLSISKEGLCAFETGGEDWNPDDDPDSPANGNPYPLVLRVVKKLKFTRGDSEPQDVVATEGNGQVEIQDGDSFEEPSKGFWFRFTWIPINLCFATATPGEKKQQREAAKLLGIKIAYKNYRPHHTHYIVKKAKPTAALLLAAAASAHIVSTNFFEDLQLVCAAPDRPSEPLPPAPGPPPPGGSKEELAAHDKEVQGFEKQLLALNDDVGADWARWWGHSHLERDWHAAWPEEKRFVPEFATPVEGWEARKLAKDEARRAILQGWLIVSFRGSPAQDESDREIVEASRGHFFACDRLNETPLLATAHDLINAISDFETEHSCSGAKLAFFVPRDLVVLGRDNLDEAAQKQLDVLQHLQQMLKVGKLCEGSELAQAVFHVSTAHLVGTDIPPAPGATSQDGESSGNRRTQRATQSTQFTNPTPPFPTGGVPGTHPESAQSGTSARMDVDGTPQAGPSGTTGSQEEDDSAPSQPRKLTRRARTGRSVFDDMFADVGTTEPEETARSSRPLTQDMGGAEGGSSAAGPSSARMAVDDAAPEQPPPTRTATQRRRGQRDAFAALFGDDSPEKDGSTQTQSIHEELMRTKKTRQERMAAIEEEDRRLAAEEAQSQSAGGAKGKGRAARAVEDEDKGVGGSRKKRDKSAAIGSGSEDDVQPARKRTSKKEGAAPVSTTAKRTRAMSRDPNASSSEDESARTARKKSKAAEEPVPKNAKEAAALKKAKKEEAAREAARLLQVKTSKRKGAEADQAFNEDFNALKIVKPVLKQMPKPEKHRFRWDEEDSDVERDRLIHQDQQRLADEDEDMDPDQWRRPTQAMFVIRTLELERKDRPPPRTDVVLDERWAGRANFKKFRPKNAVGQREPLVQRRQVELIAPDAQDFGLGAGYNDRKGTSFSQVQHADDEDDEEELLRTMTSDKGQTRLTFGAKAKPKPKAKAPAKKAVASQARGKGKAKQVVEDSESDELDSDDPTSSNTLRADDMDVDELDDDDDAPSTSKARGKKAAGKSASSTAKKAPRKAAPATILIDDSDSDSDSGLTFKGFGNKATGRARR